MSQRIIMLQYALVLIWCIYAVNADPCIPREFENGTVCVCNATYCDSTPAYDLPEIGFYIRYTSNEDGLRLDKTQGAFGNVSTSEEELLVLLRNITYQRIHGFGGCFTDSACISIKSLSEDAQKNLMSSYFSSEGNAYNLGRVPIAGTDFSTRLYTYDDYSGDLLLKNFSLADEDLYYKIPLMQQALEMSPELKFIAASWSAPPWMKTNNDYIGLGFLLKEYYQLYAEYLIKFLDEYENHGLEMWAISTGNEPNDAFIDGYEINSLTWLSSTIAEWVAENLGPTISESKHNKTLILALDDQTFYLPNFVEEMFVNETAKNYTAGIAVHWYYDTDTPSSVLQETHDLFPDKFLLMTEAAVAANLSDGKLLLGSWDSGEKYIMDIIDNLRNWVTGWIDWNLALNEEGGPHWHYTYDQSSIVVNAEADEFYKQPLFYAISHFSKFIPRGSVRVELTHNQVTNATVDFVAFVTPEDETVLVIFNKWSEERQVIISDPERGNIDLQLSPNSVQTIIYK
ncbi:lysosomal acid glucosylceramidase [Neodiprion lecontei]|uniref:Glucosylceramidase n=1 Tax=Neodiprion lecontei TaxID=441921 RepID=A0A6J0CBQ6_NEOLC|nr:lysosomal acid glucosylceramidase [Neodiprion lecontei]